jgi:CRISPR-associated protein Cas1
LTPHVPLRRAQYRRLEEPAFVLDMARGFVRAKLEHQRALLQRHQREAPHPAVTAALAGLEQFLRQVNHKTTLASLRGLEGAATAAYFSGYRRFFDPVWRFEARQRRPPPDPVNVLLSLGYTLLAELTTSAVRTVGLDPYAGFLHEVVYHRPALGLDLMEEFRPVVDGLVLWACRGGQITPDDFSPGDAERPVVLGERGRRVFLHAFEERMERRFTHPLSGQTLTLRQCLIEQARQIAHRITEGPAGYQGMGFR